VLSVDQADEEEAKRKVAKFRDESNKCAFLDAVPTTSPDARSAASSGAIVRGWPSTPDPSVRRWVGSYRNTMSLGRKSFAETYGERGPLNWDVIVLAHAMKRQNAVSFGADSLADAVLRQACAAAQPQSTPSRGTTHQGVQT
jgi:hypothetical protein